MKKYTIFTASFFAILISLWSSNSNQTYQTNTISESKSSNLLSKTDTIPDDCYVRDPITYHLTHRITDLCAVDFISEYQNTVDSMTTISPDLKDVLVYGAKVHLHELEAIIVNSEWRQNGYDSLYIMMGIVEGKTHMIFALQDTVPALKKKTLSTSKYSPAMETAYFDFTFPCPTACPR